MTQYIDKSALTAWIKEKKIPFKKDIDDGVYPTYLCALMDFEDFLDTLEVKEEVLDGNDKTKLMEKCVKMAYKRGYDMGVLQTTNKINSNIKEVDLEGELNNWRHEHFHGKRDQNAASEYLKRNNQLDIAKYFFELGLKAKGE